MLESLLDDLSGLGEVRKKALLTHFGSVTALRTASESEISEIPGIGEKIAKSIVDQLKSIIGTDKIDTETGEILGA
jgi:excinuclease ABC subunit C